TAKWVQQSFSRHHPPATQELEVFKCAATGVPVCTSAVRLALWCPARNHMLAGARRYRPPKAVSDLIAAELPADIPRHYIRQDLGAKEWHFRRDSAGKAGIGIGAQNHHQ